MYIYIYRYVYIYIEDGTPDFTVLKDKPIFWVTGLVFHTDVDRHMAWVHGLVLAFPVSGGFLWFQ